MTPAAETEIKRLTAAATEPGSVEASIRAAMVWAYRDALDCVSQNSHDVYEDGDCTWYIQQSIEERLKP